MIRTATAALILFATSALAETPLSRASPGILSAPVRVAHRALTPFVMDTGAAGCTLTRQFVAENSLAILGEDRVLAPAVELDGASLGTLTCRLGEANALGADALARFVVVLDTRAMTLSLHGGAQHGQAMVSPRARLVYAVTQTGPLALPVRLNSARGVGVLDTGARRSAMSARFAEAAGADAGDPAWFDLAGATHRVEGGMAQRPGGAATMDVGLDRLAGLRLVLDYPRRRVWLDPG